MTKTNIVLPDKFEKIFEHYRYKIAYGGRGSGKSHSIAIALLIIALQSKKRILCVREFQNSISESCHQLLCNYIEVLGIKKFFDTTNNRILCKNGSEFIFKGIKINPESVKSLEGVDICWVEEAQTLSKASLEILKPTVRNEGSEIWFSMNPKNSSDPVYQMIIDPSDNTLLIEINYYDNPHLPQTLLEEAITDKVKDYENYLHIWEGHLRTVSDALIFNRKYKVQDFKPLTDYNGPYYGCDWGFSADPTTLVKVWVYERTLYIEKEVVGYHIDTPQIPDLFNNSDKLCNRYVIRADCSRPETISYMRQFGFPKLVGCKKWPGSVEDGISFMRGFDEIIIHPSCKHTIKEFGNYSYKIDKLSGDILPLIIDKDNHCIDAIRYALEPLIMNRKPGTVRVYN